MLQSHEKGEDIDPKASAEGSFPVGVSASIKLFKTKFDQFMLALNLFFAHLQILVLAWNLSYGFNMIQFLMPGFGLLLLAIGDLLGEMVSDRSCAGCSPLAYTIFLFYLPRSQPCRLGSAGQNHETLNMRRPGIVIIGQGLFDAITGRQRRNIAGLGNRVAR